MTPPVVGVGVTLIGTLVVTWARHRSRSVLAVTVALATAGVVVGLALLRPSEAWGWALGSVVGLSVALAFSRSRKPSPPEEKSDR